MENNTAQVYLLDKHYTNIYVNLSGYEQIIFYWSKHTDCQKRKPKWRTSKETIQDGMYIEDYNDFGCRLKINGKIAEFNWGSPDLNNRPYYKGKLFDPNGLWDIEFQNDSPTSTGVYTGQFDGHYSQPQPYEED